jgi:hypothetical protein
MYQRFVTLQQGVKFVKLNQNSLVLKLKLLLLPKLAIHLCLWQSKRQVMFNRSLNQIQSSVGSNNHVISAFLILSFRVFYFKQITCRCNCIRFYKSWQVFSVTYLYIRWQQQLQRSNWNPIFSSPRFVYSIFFNNVSWQLLNLIKRKLDFNLISAIVVVIGYTGM